jgi:lysophospholipid acyltransferase (LPLAT)-like uncharacterized protein
MPEPATAHKITLPQHLASFAGGALLKTLAWTLRVRWEDRASFYDPARTSPVILCIWHNRLLGALLGDYRTLRRHPVPLDVLTSASKDGGWLAALVRRFRMGSVRGSSSRRGATALIQLSNRLADNADIAITPDGPRGPNYKVAPGIVHLARRSGAPIVLVKVQLSSVWHIGRKWDALWVPKPFSRLVIRYLPAPALPSGTADLDAACEQIAQAMGTD